MSGPPKPVRLKTYTAETGYVYQYYFVGKRRALEGAASEFIFDVSSDRKLRFSVSILVPDESLNSWQATHGRPLVDAEIYAAAKMQLTRAFDEFEDLFGQGRTLTVMGAEELADLLDTLGVE